MPTDPIHTTDAPTPLDPVTGEFSSSEVGQTDRMDDSAPARSDSAVVGTVDLPTNAPAPVETCDLPTARSVSAPSPRPQLEGTVDIQAAEAPVGGGTFAHEADDAPHRETADEHSEKAYRATGTFGGVEKRPAEEPPPPTVAPLPGPPTAANRYALGKVFARGGMGEVWLAEDTGIGRKVALKKMRKKMKGKGKEDQFFWEAQVTGQLEHPGVVPVHELGVDENGEPYYVMKLIHGRTLLEKIEEFHKAPADRPTREVERLQLIQVFLAMCQTLAFAHSRGVVHRDIKPENVMIGEYGETLVLDWGLAKMVGKDEQADTVGPLRRQSFSGETFETLAGSIKGTPWYMAPEVAAGHTKTVDQVSDVFLLGATLYHLLTGKLPREGKSLPELISAAHKPPVPLRQVDPTIASPLEGICLKAMAVERPARYQTAKELAEDLQRYLAGEPVTAYQETFGERAWRWAKRHRTAIARSVAALAVVLLAIFGVMQYREFEKRRQVERDDAARVLQEEKDRAKRIEEEKALEAAKAARLAQEKQAREDLKRFQGLAEEVRFLTANTHPVAARAPFFNAKDGLARGAEALAVAEPWGAKLEAFVLDAERPALAKDLYDLLLLLSQVRAQVAGTDAGKDVLALLARAEVLQPPTRSFHRLRAQALTAAGQGAAAQADAKKADDPATPMTAADHFLLAEQARVPATRPDEMQDRSGKFMPNRGALEKAIAEYRLALRAEPNHYWANYQLGRCLMNLRRGDEGVQALSACVALRPNSPYGYCARGMALVTLARVDEAAADFEKAIQLEPDSRVHKLHRGALAWLRGKTNDALKDFDEALVGAPEQQLPEAAFYKAQMFAELGRVEDALAAVDRALTGKNPVGRAYMLRAQIHFLQNRDPEGIDDLNRFFAASDSTFDPKSPAAAAKRARQLRLIGQNLPPGKDPVQTREFVQQAERLYRLAQTELRSAIARDGAEVFEDLGRIHELLGQMPEAINAYSKALAKTPQGDASNADRVRRLDLRGWAYVNAPTRGLFYHPLFLLAKARSDFDAAIRLAPDNAEAHTGLGYVEACRSAGANARRSAQIAVLYGPGDYLILHNVACVFSKLSETEPDRAKEFEDTALDYLARAVELWSRDKSGPNELALIKGESAFGDSIRERPEFRKLIEK